MINYRGKLRKMLSGYQGRPFVVRYWDGASEQFGQGGPSFALYFKTKESLRRSLLETSLGFGEAYARGDLTVEGDLVAALTALGEKTKAELLRRFYAPPDDLVALPRPELVALRDALARLRRPISNIITGWGMSSTSSIWIRNFSTRAVTFARRKILWIWRRNKRSHTRSRSCSCNPDSDCWILAAAGDI